jgi:hypothetical protein
MTPSPFPATAGCSSIPAKSLNHEKTQAELIPVNKRLFMLLYKSL